MTDLAALADQPSEAHLPLLPLALDEPSAACICDHGLNAAVADAATPPPVAVTRVLHVINGEHYSGAERVQDLLAGVPAHLRL